MLKRAMPPVGADDPRLLILGSLPGDASLAARRYYAHPQNQFWRLLGNALDLPLADIDYPERLSMLAARGVALWDVVETAVRPGSLDGAIRGAQIRPLAEFVAACPSLAAIAFNGKTAARLGRRALHGLEGLVLLDLPSSSAAFTMGFGEKARAWKVLGDIALGPESGRMGT